MPSSPSKTLETFPNPQPGRDYIIEIEAPEFTCLCPKTGQPDFATLEIEYVPDRLCVELKSLKLYIWSFRDEGHFHEKVTNTILNDLVAAVAPRYMRLRAHFYVRGGIYTTVTAEHRQPGWREPLPRPTDLPRTRQDVGGGNEPASTRDVPPLPDTRPAREAGPAAESAPSTESRTSPASGRANRAERFRMLRRNRPSPGESTAPTPAPAEVPTAPPTPPTPAKSKRDVYIGLDVGTSACRALAIDSAGKVLGQAEAPLPAPTRKNGQIAQDPMQWWSASSASLAALLKQIDGSRVHRLAIAGTSATLLLCDAEGNPLTPGLMYNDTRAQAEAERIAGVADDASAAHGVTSSLSKLLWLQGRKQAGRAAHALHQADWLAGKLTGRYGHSDYNNSLKLGYDVHALSWPDWMQDLEVRSEWLPEVHVPGEVLGGVLSEVTKKIGLPGDVEVVAGTTDGVAAFLAAGPTTPGQGVTSLGSTLVLKLLSEQPVYSAAHGVYSHRLGRLFLAGGASNSGGAVLAQYFAPEQLAEMTPLLDPEHPTDLDYYPLPNVGERFPVNDPKLEPRLEPLPGDSVVFYQAILEGIARIEARGYALLAELGAPAATAVWTTGTGARNPAWTRIRARTLGVPLKAARSEHAAYGAALLAAGVLKTTYA